MLLLGILNAVVVWVEKAPGPSRCVALTPKRNRDSEC